MGSGSVEAIVATALDGADARFPAGIAGGTEKADLVAPGQGGIADAWSGERGSRRRIEASLAGAGMDALRLPYPGRISTARWHHHLALSTEKRKRRRSACSKSPRRSAVPTGNPRAWPSVKRLPG
jgi:hypothetical protein